MKEDKGICIGCIADDFTGASDAASFLVKGGLKTVLCNGIPANYALPEGTQAVVIALKTRTEAPGKAVKSSLDAARWLMEAGAKQLYIKYCSTFDSTPKGNIGPVLDALLEAYNVKYTLLCPSLPVNGRIVRNGRLYVKGVLLNESSMKNHPLTPMWDSRIKNLMEKQSKYTCLEMYDKDLEKAAEYSTVRDHFYIIPDYENDEQGKRIAEIFGNLPILSGGSGLLYELAKRITKEKYEQINLMSDRDDNSGTLIIAGSCSETTRAQIEYIKNRIPSMKIDPLMISDGLQSIDDIWNFVAKNKTALIYSSDSPENVRKAQELGTERISGLLESIMAEMAFRALNAGCLRIIAAGGETSGSIIKKLGFEKYIIGNDIAPGVPVMIPVENTKVRLVLKSGNFGAKDFFETAAEAVKR